MHLPHLPYALAPNSMYVGVLYLTVSNVYCPHAPGCGAFHRSIVDLPGTMPLKKTVIPSSGMHQLSMAPQLVLGACKPPTSKLKFGLA